MILQLNQRGTWQNVVEIDVADPERILRAVSPLARAIFLQDAEAGKGATTWRVVAGRSKSPTVLWRLIPPSFEWKKVRA